VAHVAHTTGNTYPYTTLTQKQNGRAQLEHLVTQAQ